MGGSVSFMKAAENRSFFEPKKQVPENTVFKDLRIKQGKRESNPH